jgi:predicted RNA-binding Zn-ribbon protein involved in translation (DUF1610 family)
MAPLLLVLAQGYSSLIPTGTRARNSMSIHLFSTPVECTQCGTVVNDPTADKCPNCGSLLKERRTPSRLAGVPRRFGQLRFLLGTLRLLGVAILSVGILLFLFNDDTLAVRLGSLLGGALIAVCLFVVAACIEIMLDLEENTRASFRLQQLILETLQRPSRESAGATDGEPTSGTGGATLPS